MLLIKNGRVLDPASKTDAQKDVFLDGERIAEVGPHGKVGAPPGCEIFDASGLIVAPGFVDLHAHLREPGQESSETIETGTRSEEHTSELQSRLHLVCRLLLEKKKKQT